MLWCKDKKEKENKMSNYKAVVAHNNSGGQGIVISSYDISHIIHDYKIKYQCKGHTMKYMINRPDHTEKKEFKTKKVVRDNSPRIVTMNDLILAGACKEGLEFCAKNFGNKILNGMEKDDLMARLIKSGQSSWADWVSTNIKEYKEDSEGIPYRKFFDDLTSYYNYSVIIFTKNMSSDKTDKNAYILRLENNSTQIKGISFNGNFGTYCFTNIIELQSCFERSVFNIYVSPSIFDFCREYEDIK